MTADRVDVGRDSASAGRSIERNTYRSLAWATDIHLNFLSPIGVDRFGEEIAASGADAAILTGDIAEAPNLVRLLQRLADVAQRPLYFVLGNHDFYRGNVAAVRRAATELTRSSRYLRWLPAAGVIELCPDVALVGVDGWCDGRLGNYMASRVELNDFLAIEDLIGLSKQARLTAIQALADAEASALRPLLDQALARYPKVVIGTHVPPFKEACWHEGKISNDEWLPYFTCRAVGDAIKDAARAFPERVLRVLCGHTHGEGRAQILPNLKVMTGAAEYGEPRLAGVMDLVS